MSSTISCVEDEGGGGVASTVRTAVEATRTTIGRAAISATPRRGVSAGRAGARGSGARRVAHAPRGTSARAAGSRRARSTKAGRAGMIRRQKLPDSMVATSAEPLTTTKPRSQPSSSPAAGTRATRHGERACERQPLEHARAPAELAQVRHVLLPRVEVEMHGPVEPGRDRPEHRIARAGGERDLVLREERAPRPVPRPSRSSAG